MKAVGRAPNLPSQVARMISDDILAGRFRVGDRLPTERELQEIFGVSRNVIREAVARLRSDGTVEPRQGAGVFVTGTKRSAISIDHEILRDKALFANLCELRSIIESEAAALAATRRTPKQLATIAEAFRKLYDAQGTPASADADLAFHGAVARAADNVYVATFVSFISEHVRTSIVRTDERMEAAIITKRNRQEHSAIFEAIRDRNADRARECMRRHIAGATERLGLPRPASQARATARKGVAPRAVPG